MRKRSKRNLSSNAGKRTPKPELRMAAGKFVRNVLLLQIPPTEFSTIEPHLEFVNFDNADRLEREGNRIKAVYFLNSGIGSMIVETTDGRSVEVAVAGREDMIGLHVAVGLDEFSYSVVMQVPGDGFRVTAASMKRLLPSLPKLRDLVLRRLGIRSLELAQNAACNRLHNVRKRLARWLLVTHDRIDSDVIRITHVFLSKMVGTDRATVSVATAELERAGVIRQGHASIAIENRSKLEAESCDCYQLFRKLNPELGLRTKS